MRAKTVNESMHTEESYPIATVTWEDVMPEPGSSIRLPIDAGSSSVIRYESGFDNWLEEFISKYGSEGELVRYYDNFLKRPEWKVVGNPKFDSFKKASAKGYAGHYATGGRYKGD